MRNLRLLGVAFSLSLRRNLAYRANLFFDVLLAGFQLVASVGVVGIVFERTGLLAGWSAGQILVLLGTYSVLTGLRMTFLDPNLADFSQRVRDGRLDTYLLQPASSVLLATGTRHAPLALVQCVLGLGVIAGGLRHLGLVPTPAAIAAWVVLVLVGLLIGWATSAGLAFLAFWAPRLSLGVLHSAAWEFGRYPVTIYGRWLRSLLTYGFPVAAITTWPAETLTRGPELVTLATAALLATVFTGAALSLWWLGIRRYTGATS